MKLPSLKFTQTKSHFNSWQNGIAQTAPKDTKNSCPKQCVSHSLSMKHILTCTAKQIYLIDLYTGTTFFFLLENPITPLIANKIIGNRILIWKKKSVAEGVKELSKMFTFIVCQFLPSFTPFFCSLCYCLMWIVDYKLHQLWSPDFPQGSLNHPEPPTDLACTEPPLGWHKAEILLVLNVKWYQVNLTEMSLFVTAF